MTNPQIRQPIVTVVGHVDHGKTTLLDSLRDSCVQEGEKGGITQKISFTSYPVSQLKKACPLIEKSSIRLDIPGFLLIDTPGHAAFTNLRKRGGSLADLAVLVIDINEGIKPQTAEVIQILKKNKTPFIIALNKIDNISGWKHHATDLGDLKKSIKSQNSRVKQVFDERYLTIIGSLNSFGFDADLYYNISDFTKKIAIIPISAKTRQGLPELIMMLCGLSQKYLFDKLELHQEPKGVILEIKKEKSLDYAEAVLYDGILARGDEIAIANLDSEPTITKIRVLEEIEPLYDKFQPKHRVHASTGVRMQLTEKARVLPGMPFVIYKGNKNEVKKIFREEVSESIQTDKHGIIAKADSLGSLEALLFLLRQNNIPVLKVGIGNISKNDIAAAKANLKINEIDSVIVGFNTQIEEDAKTLESQEKIKIIQDEVVYKLIENLVEFRKQKAAEIEKRRLMELSSICKLKILHQYVFRNTAPAIFGVRVEAGKLISGLNLISEKNEKVGRVKNIQSENKSVQEAHEGMEVAISIPGSNFERKIKDLDFLYSDIGEKQIKILLKNKDLLTADEIKTIRELEEIKKLKK